MYYPLNNCRYSGIKLAIRFKSRWAQIRLIHVNQSFFLIKKPLKTLENRKGLQGEYVNQRLVERRKLPVLGYAPLLGGGYSRFIKAVGEFVDDNVATVDSF